MPTVGFLHTARIHVPTFRTLLRQIAPTAFDVHLVDAELLAHARRRGIDATVRQHLLHRLHQLAGQHADVVVCTCSTLSHDAEQLTPLVRVPMLRIDRPMATAAVAAGGRVAIVATMTSTLAPTRQLLEQCAVAAGSGAVIVDAPCVDAWALFEAGDHEGYLARVARHVRDIARRGNVDVIVLAQASMAPVAARLPDVTLPVLSSPRLAVQRAVALATDGC